MTKSFKVAILFILAVCLGLSRYQLATAYSCEDSCDNLNDTDKQTCLSQKVESCRAKIGEANAAKRTLESAISYFDGKIKLTQTQVNQTAFEISQLEKEINSLEGNINNLNLQLDKIGETLTARIRESYINGQINKMYLFIGSDGLTNLISRLKYLQITQNHDRKNMVLLEQARANYDAQKTAKETKQQQVLGLQTELLAQKKTLDKQQQEKEYLLVVTKHDESRYQQGLSDALAQQRAISRYVTSQGGASILSGQTKCDDWGCYYNQRDSQWGNIGLGGTNSSLAEYGCLVTSMAMITSHYGRTLLPSDIATSYNAFWPGTDYLNQGTWTVKGVTTTRTRVGSSTARIDEELNAGRPVIVGLHAYPPEHFIVLKAKTDQGYIMHDPFLENGGNRPFSDKYSTSSITAVDTVRVN